MFRILKKSLKTGIVTGQHPEAGEPSDDLPSEVRQKPLPFRRSLTIREVDTGSCNACEMEMNALANPVYDIERFGVHIAASPRHADALVVTGPVTVNMETASEGRPQADTGSEARDRPRRLRHPLRNLQRELRGDGAGGPPYSRRCPHPWLPPTSG